MGGDKLIKSTVGLNQDRLKVDGFQKVVKKIISISVYFFGVIHGDCIQLCSIYAYMFLAIHVRSI